MKTFKIFSFYLFISILSLACGSSRKEIINAGSEPKPSEINSVLDTVYRGNNNNTNETEEFIHATYYVVVIDTGKQYWPLRNDMLNLSKELNIPIDSMGRFYNSSKNLIALPDNDEDELFAGQYFPRRFPSEHLSLEYMNFYQDSSGDDMMALVAGIYESDFKADSAVSVLRKKAKKTFKVKSLIFVGCMH